MNLSEYLAVYAANNLNLTASSAQMMGYAVRSIERHYGVVLVSSLCAALVVPWLKSRLSEVARKTVKRERGDVLTLWKSAHETGHCPNPLTPVPAIKVPQKQPVAYTPEQSQQIFTAATLLEGKLPTLKIKRSDWWLSLLLTLYDTGSRPGAVLRLTPKHIDLDRLTVRMPCETAKTGLEQIVRISEQTAEALGRHYQPGRKLLFPWPFSYRHFHTEYKRLLDFAAVPTDRYHMAYAWRRTTATQTARVLGVSVAARQLGHASEAMTKRYIDPTLLGESCAVDVLPRPTLC